MCKVPIWRPIIQPNSTEGFGNCCETVPMKNLGKFTDRLTKHTSWDVHFDLGGLGT